MPKRRYLFALTLAFSLSLPALAQDKAPASGNVLSPETLAVAKELAAKGQVPLGTVLTDIITKGSTLSLESGLGTVGPTSLGPLLGSGEVVAMNKSTGSWKFDPTGSWKETFAGPSRNSRSEYLDPGVALDSPIADRSLEKGYTPRTIEFDSRFENNVARLAVAATSAGSDNGRVVGGIRLTPEEDVFPEVVAITGNHAICSGILIAPDKVLTAAHCYCDGVTSEVSVGQDTISPTERITVDRDASEVFRPCDEIKTDLGRGDVAILKLNRAVNVQPRPLTSLQAVRNAASVRAVGFGRSEFAGAGVKYMVDIVIASFQCDGTALNGIPDSQLYRCQPSHELVAAGLNRDTCGGDSGGPIFVLGFDNRIYLAGITSRAVDPGRRCGPGGVYVLPAAPPIRAWLEARGVTFP